MVDALPLKFVCIGSGASVATSAADEDLSMLFGGAGDPARRISGIEYGWGDDRCSPIDRRQGIHIPRWSDVDLILSDMLALESRTSGIDTPKERHCASSACS